MPKHPFSLIILFLFWIHPLTAQTVLENYIRAGLQSNLALQQKNFDLQRAGLDLQRANAAFFPRAGFSSDYTLADGGRSQSIPIGDLLNKAYSTLNQLTASNKFPQVANQSIQFLPNDYHDTKMEISMPLVNADIRYDRQVSGELINGRRADVDIDKRDLVKQIRQAYYQYLQAGRASEIYTNALDLEKENFRVSEKLVENRMATREIVLRAKAQISQVEASLIESDNRLRNAIAWFNFLLNRPLDTPLITDSTLIADHGTDRQPLTNPIGASPADHEELARLRSAQKVMETNLKWGRSYLVPKLNAFYDVGFQGFGFHFDNSQFYQLAGFQLRWMLFKGGDNKYKIRQAQIDIASIGSQYNEASRQLSLLEQTASNDYASAVEALQSLADEVESASETYRLAQRRFAEGQALQIELIDARTQMTGARIRYSLGQLAVLDRAAQLERVTASYKL
jgi:outer membrane protein